jgi:hypothetical protein
MIREWACFIDSKALDKHPNGIARLAVAEAKSDYSFFVRLKVEKVRRALQYAGGIGFWRKMI